MLSEFAHGSFLAQHVCMPSKINVYQHGQKIKKYCLSTVHDVTSMLNDVHIYRGMLNGMLQDDVECLQSGYNDEVCIKGIKTSDDSKKTLFLNSNGSATNCSSIVNSLGMGTDLLSIDVHTGIMFTSEIAPATKCTIGMICVIISPTRISHFCAMHHGQAIRQAEIRRSLLFHVHRGSGSVHGR